MRVSISANSAALSFQPAAAAFAATCSGRVAPAITDATAGRASEPREGQLQQRVAASTRRSASGAPPPARFCSVRKRSARPSRLAQARARGGLLALAVLAGEQAAGQGEVGQERQPVAARTGRQHVRCSGSRCNRLYSFCTLTKRGRAAATAASASRSCATEKFEQPISRTLPARTSSSSAPSVSAMGTVGVRACAAGRGRCGRCPGGAGCPPRACAHVLRAGRRRARVAHLDAELGGDHDAVARGSPSARPRNSSLVRAAVDVGGVEEVDARVERRVHHGAPCPASSRRQPKLLQPSPTTDASSDPTLRVSTVSTFPLRPSRGTGFMAGGMRERAEGFGRSQAGLREVTFTGCSMSTGWVARGSSGS